MIVGLKYAGASDGIPMRISVGDTIKLRLEGAEVSAYHNDKKVGYLSPDKRQLWNSLRPSARNRARVVGEITDEDGDIAALDVEISARPGPMAREAQKTAPSVRDAPKIDSASRPYRAGIGIAVLLATIAVMGHVNSAGPDRFAAASLVPLNSSLQYFLEEEQELRRQVQLAIVHRQGDELRRREAAAELKLQSEEQKSQGLAAALEQARQTSDAQLKRIEELEAQARLAAVQQKAESERLTTEIASLQQKIEHLASEQQKIEDEKQHAAWQDINEEELVRQRNRLTAWMVMNRVEELKTVLRNGTALEQAKPLEQPQPEVRAVSVPRSEPKRQAERSGPPEKSSKPVEEVQFKKKNNFSRYAQENEAPASSANR